MAKHYTDLMIDLETLSTKPNAVTLSTGLVAFNLDRGTGTHWEGHLTTFGTHHHQQDQLRRGRRIDRDTEAWWAKQSQSARLVFSEEAATCDSVESGLGHVLDFIHANTDPWTVRVWGNGSDFDNVILSSLLETYGLSAPWKFWNNRCFRTIKGTFRHVDRPTFQGTAHNALADAKNQVEHLWRIYEETDLLRHMVA